MAGGQFEIFPDPPSLARAVAEWILDAAMAAGGGFNVSLAGGATPKALYRLLASDEFRTRFPWSKVSWFWGDERFVPPGDPQSNFGMAREALFSRAPVPQEKIHPIPTDGSPEDAAARYERILQQAYGGATLDPSRPLFDLTLLGLGPDGHTASLLPGDPALEQRARWVAVVAKGRPEIRITLTLPALESSRRVAFLVTGAEKAAALQRIRDGDDRLPASRLRPVGELLWFADRAAAGRN